MPSIDLKITTKYSGKSSTTTVTDINSTATNTQLRQFATKLVDLSAATYDSAKKVTTVNLDTEGGE